jgi:hypothetical protein
LHSNLPLSIVVFDFYKLLGLRDLTFGIDNTLTY